MLRRSQFITVVFAAATLVSGCLSTFGTDYGPQGGSPDPGTTSGNGDRGSGGGDGTGGGGGGGGGGGQDAGAAAQPDLAGPPAPTGSLVVMMPSTSDSIRLNESKDYTVTVTPSSDFNGTVVYSLEGAPAGVTATFAPPGGMLSGATPQTVKMTLKSAGDATVGAGVALKVKATSGAIIGQSALTLDVLAELLVSIAKGVDIGTSANPNLTAFGAAQIPTIFVAPGTKVTFVNQDSINHEIHSDGTLGIAHEGGPLMANAANSYTQTFNAKGTFNFRCHIHPNMKGSIVVK